MESLHRFYLTLPYIILGILFFAFAYLLFNKKSLRAKMIFLYIIWGVGLVLLIINKLFHFARGEHILAQLPLHLCYISLIFFIPMSLRYKRKVFYDFVFYINSPGAFMALLFPARDYVDGAWSVITATYAIFHCIIVFIPLWLFLWKIYAPRISFRRCLKIVGIFIVLSLVMYGFSKVLVANGVYAANYFWTLTDNARDNVQLLRIFASVIPYDYLYLAAFAFPILVGYILVWNFALRLGQKRNVCVGGFC